MTTEAHDNATGQPLGLGLGEGLGPLVEAAGMVRLLNHGAASCVHSEGCHGVTQEHLERFAELVRAAERGRCADGCLHLGAGGNPAHQTAMDF